MRIFAILVILATQHLVIAAQTRVVILGVDHSAQFVSRAYRPAVVEAFIARVKPDAICVGRDPGEFAAGNFYEFTYEVSQIAVPYARRVHIELNPRACIHNGGRTTSETARIPRPANEQERR